MSKSDDNKARQVLTGVFELLLMLQTEVAAIEMYFVDHHGLTDKALEPYRQQLRQAGQPAFESLQKLKDAPLLEILKKLQLPES